MKKEIEEGVIEKKGVCPECMDKMFVMGDGSLKCFKCRIVIEKC